MRIYFHKSKDLKDLVKTKVDFENGSRAVRLEGCEYEVVSDEMMTSYYYDFTF